MGVCSGRLRPVRRPRPGGRPDRKGMRGGAVPAAGARCGAARCRLGCGCVFEFRAGGCCCGLFSGVQLALRGWVDWPVRGPAGPRGSGLRRMRRARRCGTAEAACGRWGFGLGGRGRWVGFQGSSGVVGFVVLTAGCVCAGLCGGRAGCGWFSGGLRAWQFPGACLGCGRAVLVVLFVLLFGSLDYRCSFFCRCCYLCTTTHRIPDNGREGPKGAELMPFLAPGL